MYSSALITARDRIEELIRDSQFSEDNPAIATYVFYTLLKNSYQQVNAILATFQDYGITTFLDFFYTFNNNLIAEWSSPSYPYRLNRVLIQRLRLIT